MEWRRLIQGGLTNQPVPDPSTYGGDFGSTVINVPTAADVSASVLAQNCPGGVLPAGVVQGSSLPGQHHSHLHDLRRTQQLCSLPVSFPRRTDDASGKPTFIGRQQFSDEPEGRSCPHRPQLHQQVLDVRTLHRRTGFAGLLRSASGAAPTFRPSATPSAIRRTAPSCTRPTPSVRTC